MNEWTEETILPYLFKEVELSDDGRYWSKRKLTGFYSGLDYPFYVQRATYKYMRPIKTKRKIIQPWTQETCPWPLSVRIINVDFLALSKSEIGIKTATLSGDRFFMIEWSRLKEYKQNNGEPCGIVEEVDE